MSSQDRQAHAVLIGVLVLYAGAYVALAAAGTYVFIFKSILIPAFAIYAIRSGEIALFVRSWFPFLASTVLFDAIRGGIYTLVELGYRPVFAQYAITLEAWVLGTPAVSIPLQEHLRSAILDRVMVGVHGLHFVYFLLFGLVIWHVNRDWFKRYTWSMIGIFYVGAFCYFLIPTVPPWMASQGLGLLPPVDHIASGIYNLAVPELYGAFDTNPVAAMPSLHAAFPALCMLLAWAALPRSAAVVATIYTAIVAFSIMYLGEHYLVDVLAGFLLAGAVCASVFWWNPPREPAPLSMAVALSTSLVVLAFLVAWVAGR